MAVFSTKYLLYTLLAWICLMALLEARPQNVQAEVNQSLDPMDSDALDEMRDTYLDLPSRSAAGYYLHPLSAERSQLLFPQLKSNAYYRSPNTWGNSYELSKRQVRYRQCYFNPVSCFKK